MTTSPKLNGALNAASLPNNPTQTPQNLQQSNEGFDLTEADFKVLREMAAKERQQPPNPRRERLTQIIHENLRQAALEAAKK